MREIVDTVLIVTSTIVAISLQIVVDTTMATIPRRPITTKAVEAIVRDNFVIETAITTIETAKESEAGVAVAVVNEIASVSATGTDRGSERADIHQAEPVAILVATKKAIIVRNRVQPTTSTSKSVEMGMQVFWM